MGSRLRNGTITRLRAFTIIELLVSAVILALLMVLLAKMLDATSSAWTTARGKVGQFQQARESFDALTRYVSEATLNTHYGYLGQDGDLRTAANSRTFVPDRYVRRSELRFLSGRGITGLPDATTHAIFFQAPLGYNGSDPTLENLLNTCGFFVELGDDKAFLPDVLDASFATKRFRLFQLIQPSVDLSVYGKAAGNASYENGYNGRDWFQQALADPDKKNIFIIGENIIALVALPMLSRQDQAAGGYTDASLAPDYLYDSTDTKSDANLNPKNQLPPIVQLTMVAIDEESAKRMTDEGRTELKGKLDGLFKTVGDVKDSSQPGYAQDLKTLEDYLVDKRITYQVFSSNVSLKAAKWSRQQKN